MKSQFIPSDKPEGRYKDIEKISTGGMGIVFRAVDTVLDKPVAIKTIIFDSMTEFYVPRFQREAKLISKLNHPNIVNILDFGITREQEPYMVMDYIEGKSLEEQMKEGKRFSIQEIKEIVLQICRGVKHAHDKGIVHRDLKPSNVLIAENALPDQNVKVIDFGIAKEVEPEQGFNTSGEVLTGSPHYMSPEQIQHEMIDERSDIYSLGCIMYRMLFGVPPFDGETALDTMRKHLNEMPEILESEQSVSDEFQGLVEIIIVCMNKKVEDRFASIDELIESFTDLKGESTLFTTERKVHKSKNLSGLFMLAIGSLILVGSILFLTNVKEEKAPAKVEEKRSALEISLAKFNVKPYRRNPQHLDLELVKYSQFSEEDLKVISESDKRIGSLKLQDAHLTNEGLKCLVKFPIESLNIERTHIDDGAAKYLKQLDELRELNIGNTAFGEEGINEMLNPKILRFQLGTLVKLNDTALKTIVEKWSNLAFIDLSFDRGITDKGLLHLKGLNNLRDINLSGQPISDELVDILLEKPLLQKICISDGIISKKNLTRLASKKNLNHLEALRTIPDYVQWSKEVKKGNPKLSIVEEKKDRLKVPHDLDGTADLFINHPGIADE